jgi:predicted HTH transcriptional regulator
VYYWIKEVKSGRKDLSNVLPPGMAQDEALDDCIAKAVKENPDPSTRKIAKALNMSSMKVQNHLSKSLGMKCWHIRWVPHTVTAAQRPNGGR